MAPILSRLADKYGLTFSPAAGGGAAAGGLNWASGGVISDFEVSGTYYRAHIFTSSGTFEVTDASITSVDYLIVGGGGAGGMGSGGYATGGGGAGGFRTTMPEGPGGGGTVESQLPISVGLYTVTVGGGGSAGANVVNGSPGNQSAFYPSPVSYPHPTYIRSEGGGGGGYGDPTGGASGWFGGSGGGGGAARSGSAGNGKPGNSVASPPAVGAVPVPAQGYAGATGNYPWPGSPLAGGGGGGAGGNGIQAGRGGVGKKSTIVPDTTAIGAPGPAPGLWFAGGGASAEYSPGTVYNGGGNPSASIEPWAGAGSGHNPNGGLPTVKALSGTGSGGGSSDRDGLIGGDGGSGIVVVRYQIPSSSGTAKATGGAISFYNGMTIHTFTSSGTFTNPTSLTVDYLIVGGGGGGGYNLGGGGGGGLVYYKTGVSLPASPYPVQVGAGGAGDTYTSGTGSTGGSSIFNSVTASGGGGGGSRAPGNAGASGGSGGGASIDGVQSASTGTGDPSPTPGTANQVSPANGWGNDGGGQTSSAGGAKAGGGGGAGGVGQTGAPTPYAPGTVGFGGPGLEYTFTGSPVFYGGGGGGGGTGGPDNTSPEDAYGGFGFPNNAGSPTPFPGTRGGNGYENLGGGGGGGPNTPGYLGGGSGGSGIVIIAYPT